MVPDQLLFLVEDMARLSEKQQWLGVIRSHLGSPFAARFNTALIRVIPGS